VVSFTFREDKFKANFNGSYRQLTQPELFSEMHQLLTHLELKKTIFRSDHASNYLSLKGVLGKDKEKLLTQIRTAINTPKDSNLRQEWQRGL
jgi:hypothetical protein